MRKYIENTGANTLFVGGQMIPPGEGRLVDVADEPVPELAEKKTPSLDERVQEILAGNVTSVLAELPTFSNEALDRAVELEKAGAARKGVLNGIAAEQISRADAKLQAEQTAARAQALEAAQAALMAAKAALDAEGDTDKHPALQAAVDEAQAKVTALSDDQA
ncbi:hypothetical protein [Rhodoferax sp.]|uniref:hypothetical protein n=1 Tax=Rhodoferax sp. TaxID=50421 RepID=UPI00274A6619|nr:hypothetical protein [Rhodoferax sp.]